MTISACPAPAATPGSASSAWWPRSAWARSASCWSPRSRACRACNSDWHRVIELCAVFRTLIADEDGIYDAQDPNDRLLLGVKGTLFAAELHILHARMRGNLLNKARRGELALRLPVGYRRLGRRHGRARSRRPGARDPGAAVRALRVAAQCPRGAALLPRAPVGDAAPDPARRRGRAHRLAPAHLPDDPAGAHQPGLCRRVRLRPAPAPGRPGRPAHRRRSAPAGRGMGYRRAGASTRPISATTSTSSTGASCTTTSTISPPRAEVRRARALPCCRGSCSAAAAGGG